MGEKKIIKISLSTFIFIVAVLILCIMSYFLYNNYTKRKSLEEEIQTINNEKEKLSITVNEIQGVINSSKQNKVEENTEVISSKSYGNREISGIYKYSTKVGETYNYFENRAEDLEAWYNLYLYENGTFDYSYGIQTNNSILGNYRIDGNMLILNKMFIGGNDVGLGTTSGEIKLTINDNGTLADTNKLLESNVKAAGLNADLSNILLEKSSEDIKNTTNIMDRINNSVSEGAIYVSGNQ